MGFMDKLVSGKELIGVKKRRSQSYIYLKNLNMSSRRNEKARGGLSTRN